jgi:hypothetical protein
LFLRSRLRFATPIPASVFFQKGVEYLLRMVEGKGVAGNWAEAKVIADGRQTR